MQTGETVHRRASLIAVLLVLSAFMSGCVVVALLLFPDQRVESIDLGPAELIDQAESAFLLAVRNLNKDPVAAAHALYQKVFAPLVPRLGAARKLYLSPDASLNLIPFAALHDGKRYLLDAPYQIMYLSSGRDLLRGSLGQAAEPPFVLADPDYGLAAVAAATPERARTMDSKTRSLYEGLGGLTPLAGARSEGTLLGSLLGSRPLLGAEATEASVRQVRAPALLHIATHGLFLGDPGVGEGRSSLLKLGRPQPAAMDQILGRSKDHSLSRAAVVLAGAAHAAEAPDVSVDGLLTAEEARSLNLFGTQLAVLSACDTGRGSVKAGQGVYGMRRAFFVAGAETVVMSLWPVSDPGTQSLMERYYRLLLDKRTPRGRVSALSEAMKGVKTERPHPYYWAPFVAIGRDAPLALPAQAPRP
ncbi:MAG: CHAT domain-containing protein [Polyangia bacterium]